MVSFFLRLCIRPTDKKEAKLLPDSLMLLKKSGESRGEHALSERLFKTLRDSSNSKSSSLLKCELEQEAMEKEMYQCDTRKFGTQIPKSGQNFRIIQSGKCPHAACGMELAWDGGHNPPQASVESGDPTDWKFVPVSPGVFRILK